MSHVPGAGAAVSKRKREDATVKIDAKLVRIAKIVAAYRDTTVAEYLSERLRPLIEADHAEEMEKNMPGVATQDVKPGGKPKK